MERRQGGLTLTELLTTLAVAGIVLSFAAPALQSGLAEQRRTTTINELVATLQVARSSAITHNASVTVCPSGDGAKCAGGGGWEQGWIAFSDPDGSRRPPAGERLLASHAGDPALTIRSREFARFLAYRPTGQLMVEQATMNTGQFTICDGRGAAAARVLAINASGRPRLDDQQVDGRQPRCPRD